MRSGPTPLRVFLDTSCLYNSAKAAGTLSDAERRFFAEREARLYASAGSIWEMRLKYRARHPSGARKSPFDPNAVVVLLRRQEMTFLPSTMHHAAGALAPPLAHEDPFDELLLVQAQEEGLRFLTVDRRLVGPPLAVAA